MPLANAIGFVLGFTIVFVTLGAFAGAIGHFLIGYSAVVNVVTGLVVVVFGLNYLGVIPLIGVLPFNFTPDKVRFGFQNVGVTAKPITVSSSLIFGAVLAVGWIPCAGAFLGAALLRASQQGSMAEGMFMLFIFSMGLGLPFIASALLIDRLKDAFAFIKRHYRVVNVLSGGLLVLVGVLMISGLFGRFTALFISG